MSEFRVRLEQDIDPESPREWDNLGTMICFHNRYNLGDDHNFSDPSSARESLVNDTGFDTEAYDDWLGNAYYMTLKNIYFKHEDAHTGVDEKRKEKYREILSKHYIMLPLYLYDHSGITMNTTGFSCGWDSGQVGFIYVSIEKVKAEYGWKNLTKERREKICSHLKGEVETYDQYLTGDVWGFIVEEYELDEDGDEVVIEEHDSCGGFYGEDAAREEGESMIKYAKEKSDINAQKRMNVVAQMGIS